MKFLSKGGDKDVDMINLGTIFSSIWSQTITLAEDAGTATPPLQELPRVTFAVDTPGSGFCVSRNSERSWELAAREILIGRCNMERSEVGRIESESQTMLNVVALIQEAHQAYVQRYRNFDMSRPDLANIDTCGVWFDYFGLGSIYRDYFDPDPCYGTLIFVPEPATAICDAARVINELPFVEPTEITAPEQAPEPEALPAGNGEVMEFGGGEADAAPVPDTDGGVDSGTAADAGISARPVRRERPRERPVEPPVERPVERPVEPPTERPVEPPTERPLIPLPGRRN